ncbi:hypothetical protein [Zoogloea sp. LCSB751]|uniref:hypothetical protein n=1 Tax=Zoogloea sp. LCSB751 TaxID=1965277 RepID=UPI001C1F8CAF|nr:hypothetical protein [Zoogloea sp. LCSB751]
MKLEFRLHLRLDYLDGLVRGEEKSIGKCELNMDTRELAPVSREARLDGVEVVGVQNISASERAQNFIHVSAKEIFKRDPTVYVPDDGSDWLKRTK